MGPRRAHKISAALEESCFYQKIIFSSSKQGFERMVWKGYKYRDSLLVIKWKVNSKYIFKATELLKEVSNLF
jgi:hypothetical protein